MKINHSILNILCGLFTAVIAGSILPGCATMNTAETGNYLTSEITDRQISAIASDVAEFLAWKYPPAKTGFDFKIPPKDGDLFGASLRDRLRTHGFAISENTGSGKQLRYMTDNDGAEWIRVILNIDGKIYAKSYSTRENASDLKWTSAITDNR